MATLVTDPGHMSRGGSSTQRNLQRLGNRRHQLGDQRGDFLHREEGGVGWEGEWVVCEDSGCDVESGEVAVDEE